MKAIVCHGKKDLRVEDVADAPLAPDEVRVAVAYGGICGSDMHYYHNGAVGDFALREPMSLGHEVSGRVLECGSSFESLRPGIKVALNPSRACHSCSYCLSGRSNLCANMYFLGSAARLPHVQGGFRQHLTLREDQIVPVPEDTNLLNLSCAEPLSVGLHAVNRAGSLVGKRVLVTGSGPIGLLTAASALHAGALEVVATDIEDAPLDIARSRIGVHHTVNVGKAQDGLDHYAVDGGYFDVAFEASGSAVALQSILNVVRRGGRVVQLGMHPPGMTSVPMNKVQTREIDLVGAFRAHDEFELAVNLIVANAIDVTPILSGTYPLTDAVKAFELAGDRSKVVKLHFELN